MNQTTIIIGSITYTMKAKRALVNQCGIETQIIKESGNNTKGCAYGLRFRSEKTMDVIGKLREMQIGYTFLAPKDE